MKTFVQCLLASAALVVASWNLPASAQVDPDDLDPADSAGQNLCSVLTIHADGTCQFTSTGIESRESVEERMRQWDRYNARSENENEEEDNPLKPAAMTSTNVDKPFTDDELVKKVTASVNEHADDPEQKNTVTLSSNTVTTVATRTYGSLEEMLKRSRTVWSAGGVAFENVRLETDTNQLLRLTLTPPPGMERYQKRMRSQWKITGLKVELKLVFPGPVVVSGFPVTQTNATWLTVDSQKEESLDALGRLYSAPIVITAEAPGLKLAQPLEAKKLWRSRGPSEDAADALPITDAGPGFVAEAQSVATTTLHVFPGGEKYFRSNDSPTGTVVNVKLFAPKGRTMKSASEVRVLAAVDNQGRSLLIDTNEAAEATSERHDFGSSESSETASLSVELRLPLPPPDAQSIDHLSAEAVATTIGSWRTMTLTNLPGSLSNELDLASVLAGARLIITKITSKEGQFNLHATLKGPPSVKNLDVRAKYLEKEDFNSSSYDRSTRTQNGQTTRNLIVQGYDFRSDGPLPLDSIVLVIRYPDDLKRERVKFELKTLDLY